MEVEIILDSIINGTRIITIRAQYPRCIHAEILKHRNCAVSAASSRAIPVKKMIGMVETSPFIPWFIGSEKPGMSPGEEVAEKESVLSSINRLRKQAIEEAFVMSTLGAHKSLVNRYLEPWLEINTLTTAALPHWEHLISLRNSEHADPIAQRLAQKIDEAISKSRVVKRQSHLPFGDDLPDASRQSMMISAARCARLSYTPFGEPEKNIEKDLNLANKLLNSGHATPFEHVVLSGVYGVNAIASTVFTFREMLEDSGELTKKGRKP